MNCKLHYLPLHAGSCKQSREALHSFLHYGWNVELVEGYTPETADTKLGLIKGGRLYNFQKKNQKKFLTKRACVLNHVRFWKEVVASNEPQVFLEHDTIAIAPLQECKFEDVLVLNMDFAFKFGALRGKFRDYPKGSKDRVVKLGKDYPLKCNINSSPFKGSSMVPGTAAYAITPKGAAKMLQVTEERGLEQSDFILNNMNVTIEYLNPSPVKFNNVNLKTSHGH